MRVGPVREEPELLRLVGASLSDVRPPVADVHAEQSGEAVEITIAVVVVDVAALAARDDRDLAVAEAGEVQPEVALRHLLQRSCSLADVLHRARHTFPPLQLAVLYKGIDIMPKRQLSVLSRAPA